MEELKKNFHFMKETISVDERFIKKYKLTSYDIRELMMFLFIYKLEDKTTINSNLLKVFDDFKIKYVSYGIGWRVLD